MLGHGDGAHGLRGAGHRTGPRGRPGRDHRDATRAARRRWQPVIVTTTDLNVSGNITVDNPGSSLLTQQQCLDLSATAGSYCLGTSDQSSRPTTCSWRLVPDPGRPHLAVPPAGLGDGLDRRRVDRPRRRPARGPEHRLVQTFSRPEIRGYIVARMQDIVNKKLYGEPMDDREKAAYAELEAIFKDKLVSDSKWALEEYDKWNANPCGYVPPPPPTGSGLPAVPNDAASSTLCTSAGSRFAVWKITNGTPPASVFDTWASYRHPTPGVQHITDGRYQKAIRLDVRRSDHARRLRDRHRRRRGSRCRAHHLADCHGVGHRQRRRAVGPGGGGRYHDPHHHADGDHPRVVGRLVGRDDRGGAADLWRSRSGRWSRTPSRGPTCASG